MSSPARLKKLTRTLFYTALIPLVLASSAISAKKSRFRHLSLQLPTGEVVVARLATSARERSQGLSGVAAKNFRDNEGMFFFYPADGWKRFWMPNTYFDLDIFFLDKNLVVTALERGLPHHPGKRVPPPIAQTKKHFCRHVLELKSKSPIAKKIRRGTRLKVLPPPSLWQIK